MTQRLRGLLWLVLLCAVVVGVPVLIHRAQVVRPPSEWPSLDEALRAVRQGRVSDDAVITALAVVLFVAWFRFVASVLVASWCAVRGLSRPHVPVLGGTTQRFAVTVVAGVMMLVTPHLGVQAAPATAWTPGSPVLDGGSHRLVLVVGDARGTRSTEPPDATQNGERRGGSADAERNRGGGRRTDRTDRTTPSDTPPTTPATSVPSSLTASGNDEACAPVVVTDSGGVPGGLGGAVLLAGGVLTAVGLRRRTTLRSARPGSRVPTPSGEASLVESRLRALAPVDRLVRLDVTVRSVAALLLDQGAPSSTQLVTAVVHGDGRIDITLSADAPAPAPFESISPDWWRLPATVALQDLAPIGCRVGLPSPTLVHLGAAEGGDLFVDLEATGLLAVAATEETAAPLVRALVASLCTSPFAASSSIIGAGVSVDDLLDRTDAEIVESVDAALDLAAITLGSTTGMTSGGMTTARLRAQSPTESWDPALVLVAPTCPLSPHEAADLVALTATPGRGLAVLCGRDVPGARWRLEEAEGLWTLQPLGMVVRPVGVSVDEVESVRQLLREAARPALDETQDPLAARRMAAAVPTAASPFRDRPWTFVVRVMGPVSIESSDRRPLLVDKGRSIELICWLALHAERPSRSGARAALWDTDVRDATFANVVSDARRALARAVSPPPDSEWLGRTLGENLPLHPEVVTDADLLAARLEHARRQTPTDAVTTLRQGLEWVRGLPFSGTAWNWPDADGITSRLVLLVTTAAAEMAHLCLGAGDVEGLFWATGKGLAVLPGHEELVGLRMRAHADRGDLAAVRLEWDSYLRSLQADAAWGEPEPAPKLVALRRELLSPAHLHDPAEDAVPRVRAVR